MFVSGVKKLRKLMEVLDATQLYIEDTTVYSEGTTTGREDAP